MNTSAQLVMEHDEFIASPTADFRLGLALILVTAFASYGGLALLVARSHF